MSCGRLGGRRLFCFASKTLKRVAAFAKSVAFCALLKAGGNCLVWAGVYPISRVKILALRKRRWVREDLCRFLIRIVFLNSRGPGRPDIITGSDAPTFLESAP